MARKHSAGILLYRIRHSVLEVFLVHPGGPFWANKDAGAWSIPKGELGEHEHPLEAAKREFLEETGVVLEGNFDELAPAKQAGGKIVYAWAMEGDCDPASIRSDTFSLKWPPGSGRMREFPEVDRAQWFPLPQAREKIIQGQKNLLDQLEERVSGASRG